MLRRSSRSFPQFNQSHISLNLELQSTFKENTESFQTSFRGGWDRYKRLKTISDAFAQEADELKETLHVVFEFDPGLAVDSADFKTLAVCRRGNGFLDINCPTRLNRPLITA